MSSTSTASEPRLGAVRAQRRQPCATGLAVVLLTPTAVPLVVFALWPLIGNVVVSTEDRRLTRQDSPSVGLENWRSVLREADVVDSLAFTFLYAVVVVVITLSVTVAAAVALHDRPRLRAFTGNAIVLPIATSLAIASIGWRLIFGLDGPVNQGLDLVGIVGPNWLRDPGSAPLAVIVVGCWADCGLLFLLFSAAMSRVPGSLVDAAKVFGQWNGVGHKLRLFVPLLRRTIVVAAVLAAISALQSFDQVLLLTDGGPDGHTRTLAFLAWERSFRFFDLGDGATISLVLVVVIAVVALGITAVLRRVLSPAWSER